MSHRDIFCPHGSPVYVWLGPLFELPDNHMLHRDTSCLGVWILYVRSGIHLKLPYFKGRDLISVNLFYIYLYSCIHEDSASVNGGLSGASSVRRPGSEDPYWH